METPESKETLIQARRQWNRPYKIAIFRLADVEDIRWRKFSGGIRKKANRRYLHGYVPCDRVLAGKLAHSCKHGPPPHLVKVCITRKGNEKVWAQVLARVVPDDAPPFVPVIVDGADARHA